MPITPYEPRRARLLLFLAASCVCALLQTRSASAQRRYYDRNVGVPWVDRPLVVDPKELQLGLGFGGGTYAYSPGENGVGMALDASVGVLRHLELGGGFGVRFGWGAQHMGAERFARVDQEWLPSDQSDPNRAMGTDTFDNPYFRVRYAFLNWGVFRIGIEAYSNFPFAHTQPYGGFPTEPTCWSPTLGLPISIVIGHRVRFDTGYWNGFLAFGGCNGYLDTYLYVPFRANFEIVRRFWLGVRTAFESHNYRVDGDNFTIPLGFQGGIRIVRQLEIQFDFIFPQFIHYDPGIRRTVFFEAFGGGVNFVIMVP